MYAGLGVALHHFTEVLDGKMDVLDLHRATTVLTKQVCDVIGDDDALATIEQLVTDPQRVAMPNGRRVAELCGETWNEVRDVAARRSAASCDGAREFGHDAILNLAVVRGVGATEPWWGTPMWRERVERVPADAISTDDREELLERPEFADDELLSMVLGLPAAIGRVPHSLVAAALRREPHAAERVTPAATSAVLTR